MMKFSSPLGLFVSAKKKFIFNLNNYRNAHFQVLSKAKRLYKEYMSSQIEQMGKVDKIAVIYRVHKGDKKNFDLGNICSIHQKFFEDAIVELGKLTDDNIHHIPVVIFCAGNIDTNNPRVDIQVVDLKKQDLTKIIKEL